MSHRVVSSAPGKIILFGEHAVVHGVTAVAASLSDLRIYVDVATTSSTKGLCIHLHDFGEAGEQKEPFIVQYSDLRESLGDLLKESSAGSPATPENPGEEYLAPLRERFESYANPAAHGLMAIGYLMVKLLPELVNEAYSSEDGNGGVGLRIDVKSIGLPIGGGLGSSAAFSVSLSAALLKMRQKIFRDVCKDVTEEGDIGGSVNWPKSIFDNEFILGCAGISPRSEEWLSLINGWSYAAEVVIHGAPSGLDNTTSCYGGALKYQRNSGKFDRLSHLPSFKILLTNTKVPRSTKVLVAGVKDLRDKMPGVIQPIFSAIEDISQRFLKMAGEASDRGTTTSEMVDEMAHLVRINHCLLNGIGVGHESLDEVFATSARHGLACKLTGAGGGGCAITLLNDQRENWVEDREAVRKDIEKLGYDTFLSGIGGEGVQWHA